MSCSPQIESLGVTFITHGQLRSAAWFFARCLIHRPTNAHVWYGLGNAMTTLGFRHAVTEWTEFGIACHKRAKQEAGGNHPLSGEFLEMLENETPEGKELVAKISAWDQALDLMLERIPFTAEVLVQEYRQVDNEDDQFAIVVFASESNLSELVPLFEFILLSQEDQALKMIVLERIHVYKAHQKTAPTLQQFAKTEIHEEVKPYFDRALERIEEPWADALK